MSAMEMDSKPAGSRRGAGAGAVLAAFTLAIFTSAFLLFAVQPMFTRMVLPQLGGSPAVWSVAMVFFQALLLAGYLYAHVLTTKLGLRQAAFLHLLLMALTAITLPIGVSAALGAPPAEGQAGWLIGVFLVSVGLPFFAVAGNGPLLQAWFARSGHPQARSPYFLYGASNLGSFAALLLYPVLFEPLLSVKAQSAAWSMGFVLLMGSIALAAGLIRNADGAVQARSQAATPPPSAGAILGWVALAFIPSGLLVAVTAHISTDVAAAPFLWVIPLALFLLTFVLIFRDRPLMPMRFLERILPIMAGGLVLFSYFGSHMFVVLILVHTGFFFVAALVCHDRLYAARPAPEHLTAFYLWMSVGGVLGGLFSGLLAPQIFNRVIEYPLLVVAAVLALPALRNLPLRRFAIEMAPLMLLGLAANYALWQLYGSGEREVASSVQLAFLGATALAMLVYWRVTVFAAMLPMLFFTLDTLQHLQGGRQFERSFFGVHKLETREDGQFRVLSHGTTIHGAMRIRNADGSLATGRPKPLTYYHPEGPIAETLRATRGAESGRHLGVVGLGAGAHVCNGSAKDRWRYYEIDSSVERIARDPRYFRFLSDCAPETKIIIGDARLTLAKDPEAYFDNLLIDAFSSDAIPMHLLTREAMALYLQALKPDGILTIHISNRHLELESVVGALAREAGVRALFKNDAPVHQAADGTPLAFTLENRTSSMVVAIAKNPEVLLPLAALPGWAPIDDRGVAAWTDDYSNILGALWRRYTR